MNSGYASVRRLFHIASIASLLVGISVLVVVLNSPLEFRSESSEVAVATQVNSGGQATERVIRLADFGGSLEKLIQRPLHDPKPEKTVAKVEKVKAAPPRLDVQVVGTAIASDVSQTRAWITLPSNKEQMISVGDELSFLPGSPMVRLIEQGRVVFSFDGRDVVVAIRKD